MTPETYAHRFAAFADPTTLLAPGEYAGAGPLEREAAVCALEAASVELLDRYRAEAAMAELWAETTREAVVTMETWLTSP